MNNNQYRSYQDLIERLADAAADHKRIPTSQRMAYKYGYLIGILINLAYNDSAIRHQLIERLKRLTNT